MENIKKKIEHGECYLGIELGSTRIKAVLIDSLGETLAVGGYGWENQLVNDFWTYSTEDVWKGISACYLDLKNNVKEKYSVTIKNFKAMGFSGMMHGYMVFDKDFNHLAPFRTWRNTKQEEASNSLTKEFQYPVPQRFSAAHIYQAILNNEEHVNDIDFQTTLAGYVHYVLTGKKVIGIGEASGIFPIDIDEKDYNKKHLETFNNLIKEKNISWKYEDILPKVLVAGELAGKLTYDGAILIDPTGDLCEGIPFVAPEGDAGTGMVATNSISVRTGNISAGTSVFAMIVLEKELSKLHKELELVTTPTGDLVAMVHSNNCTSYLNNWINIFNEVLKTFGFDVSTDDLYTKLFEKALEGDVSGGGVLTYGYLSGEHITEFEVGRPLFVSNPNQNINLANFLRSNLYSSIGALKVGLEVLFKENVKIDTIYGHGGFFKTENVGQYIMSQATGTPISVLETASEGGAWGMAILSAYLDNNNVSLNEFLENTIFSKSIVSTVTASKEDCQGFDIFMERYKKGLPIERSAIDNLI
ncbi:MAG: xylulokinase [Lachnospirales bacterium]